MSQISDEELLKIAKEGILKEYQELPPVVQKQLEMLPQQLQEAKAVAETRPVWKALRENLKQYQNQ